MSEQDDQRERLIEETAKSPAADPVTVAVFWDPATANMARMALEAAGITPFLQGENANVLIPGAFSAKLQVLPEDEAAARRVLEEAQDFPDSIEDVTAAEIAAEREGH
jgi:hypothetical protein